jgi:hypothetical protein
MKLDDLLDADEYELSEWLRKNNLIHNCDCGYTVYDPDSVEAVVQRRWGDRRWKEINAWACDLSNRYGWLFIENSKPEYGIYHCQYCADSEWSLLMDLEKMAEGPGGKKPKVAKATSARPAGKRREKYLVYVDESYSNEFPRLPGGSLAIAAFIVSERDSKALHPGLQKIMAEAYRGQQPNELKYSKVAKRPGLLERVGRGVSELISSLPSAALIVLHVPSEGLLTEGVRVVRALAHYARKAPTKLALKQAASKKVVEDAVRNAVNRMAQTTASAVAQFIGSRNLRADILFDPRSDKVDQLLQKELGYLLPKIPINTPLIPHAGTIVMPPPSKNMERLGRRIAVKISLSSEQSAGLQIADFIAGDIRAFFSEVPEPLLEGTSDKPLVNSRVLFPEAFRPSSLSAGTKQKIENYKGKSVFPLYRGKLVNGLVACFALNGQMRNVDFDHGVIYDIMD